MSANRLQQLNRLGQSLWLDGLCRRLLLPGGELQQLVEHAGVRGVTAHQTMAEHAICESHEYDEAIGRLARQSKSAEEIYEALLCDDVGRAADILRPIYERTEAGDGFVCLPVTPTLAGDARGTVAAARRLWARLNRPNVMVMVPGTREGLPAIQQLISEGINVNVTLLFSVPCYEEVAEAYVTGLQRRLARGESLARVASVASFCLAHVDGLLDPQLERVIRADRPKAELARQLQGQIAIANARGAYQSYQTMTAASRWQRLASQGARPQRLLWADLGRGHLADRSVEYVDALIGPGTISALARGAGGLPSRRPARGLPGVRAGGRGTTAAATARGSHRLDRRDSAARRTGRSRVAAALSQAVGHAGRQTPGRRGCASEANREVAWV